MQTLLGFLVQLDGLLQSVVLVLFFTMLLSKLTSQVPDIGDAVLSELARIGIHSGR